MCLRFCRHGLKIKYMSEWFHGVGLKYFFHVSNFKNAISLLFLHHVSTYLSNRCDISVSTTLVPIKKYEYENIKGSTIFVFHTFLFASEKNKVPIPETETDIYI